MVSSLESPDTPAVGFAFGLERLMFALESIDFKGDPDFLHLYLMILGDEQKKDGLQLLNRCRLGGLTADIDFQDKGMKAKWKQASYHNARFVAIFGDQEKRENQINVKDQTTGKEVTIPVNELYNYIIEELMKPTSACQGCTHDSCDDCE